MASNELADKLARRCKLNDDKNGEKELGPKSYRSIYAGLCSYLKLTENWSKLAEFEQNIYTLVVACLIPHK